MFYLFILLSFICQFLTKETETMNVRQSVLFFSIKYFTLSRWNMTVQVGTVLSKAVVDSS